MRKLIDFFKSEKAMTGNKLYDFFLNVCIASFIFCLIVAVVVGVLALFTVPFWVVFGVVYFFLWMSGLVEDLSQLSWFIIYCSCFVLAYCTAFSLTIEFKPKIKKKKK